MELSMGRELESRLAKSGISGMSLEEMLAFFTKTGDTYAVAQVEQLINNEKKIHGAKQRSTSKSLVAVKATKKTVAKTTSKARGRSAERQTTKNSYAVK
jgi:DNA repair protein RadC